MVRSGAEAVDVYSHLLPQRAHEAERRMRSVSLNPAHILPTNDDGLSARQGSPGGWNPHEYWGSAT